MADATVSRLGQVNLAGDNRALFYQLFTGEVLAAFDKKVTMAGRHRVRNITHGKSAGFANTGRAVGRYHVPGAEIVGQAMRHNETLITIDDLLIADVFVASIDEAMNHYEVRGEYSKQLGQALARTYDKQALRAAITAARTANRITGLPGGTEITLTAGYAAATEANKAIELAAAIFTAHRNLLDKDVDLEGVFAVVNPVNYFRLVQNKELLNRDWGGVGSYGDADLPKVAGIPIVVSNMLPAQNDGTPTGTIPGISDGGDIVAGKYAGNYSTTEALIMTPDAIGTVNLLDLAVESEYDIRRQGTLIVAKKLCGTGVLRPECAVEIKRP